MKFWRLWFKHADYWLIIRASSEQEAREVVFREYGSYYYGARCEVIPLDGEPQIIAEHEYTPV